MTRSTRRLILRTTVVRARRTVGSSITRSSCQQTANLGADYRVPGWPLTIGGNLNWTPGYDTRLSEIQTATQGRKVVADAYGLWVFGPALQLRLSMSNLNPREYLTGGSTDGVEPLTGLPYRETSITTARTFLNVQLRLEMKL